MLIEPHILMLLFLLQTIVNLAGKMLALPYECQFDQSIVTEMTKLEEDAEEMTATTYNAVLGLGADLLDLILAFMFLGLPFPIGTYEAGQGDDSWMVPVLSLVGMLILQGTIFAFSGSNTELMEAFIGASHERTQIWHRLFKLSSRLMTINGMDEASSLKELQDKLSEGERGREWEFIVFMDSLSWKARW